MTDLPPEKPSGVLKAALGQRGATALKSATFYADARWFVATLLVFAAGWAKLDANAQNKVDTLEHRLDGDRHRLEQKVDAILIGLNIPMPIQKDGGQ